MIATSFKQPSDVYTLSLFAAAAAAFWLDLDIWQSVAPWVAIVLGVVQVLVGSVVIAYVGADGNVVTQVVMGGQQFDARTGQITPIPNFNQKEMVKLAKETRVGPNVPPTTFTVDHTIYYVSPTIGQNGNSGPPPGGG